MGRLDLYFELGAALTGVRQVREPGAVPTIEQDRGIAFLETEDADEMIGGFMVQRHPAASGEVGGDEHARKMAVSAGHCFGAVGAG